LTVHPAHYRMIDEQRNGAGRVIIYDKRRLRPALEKRRHEAELEVILAPHGDDPVVPFDLGMHPDFMQAHLVAPTEGADERLRLDGWFALDVPMNIHRWRARLVGFSGGLQHIKNGRVAVFG